MYTLVRLSDGSCKRGELSFAMTLSKMGWAYEGDARPRVGVQMLVGATVERPGAVPSVRITSRVVRILSDAPTAVEFETESGSVYLWSCDGGRPH